MIIVGEGCNLRTAQKTPKVLPVLVENRIMLSGSSQGESSVLRVRLEGSKNPIMNTH